MAAQLVKLSDVVDEMSISAYDDDRKKYLRYTFFAKRTFLDLHFNLLSRVERQFIKVNPRTHTAILPKDYYKFMTVSIVDDCGNIIPLSKNEYMNITAEVVKETCKETKCNVCGQSASEVCDEVQNFQTITEVITMSEQTGTACNYRVDLTELPFAFPYSIIGHSIDDVMVLTTNVIADQAALDAYFSGLGFTKQSAVHYFRNDDNEWGYFYFSVDGTTDVFPISVGATACAPIFAETDYTKTTQIKTCANGDIIQRVTEPINIATEGIEKCDYTVEIARGEETICDYEIDFNPEIETCDYCFDVNGLVYPIINATVSIGGVYYNSGALANSVELGAWLVSIGFYYDAIDGTYCINDSTFVVSDITINPPQTLSVDVSGCSPFSNVFPFWIYSYTKNGSQVSVNTIINDQTELDAFFTSIGFTNSGGNIYTLSDSSDVWGEVDYGIYDPSSVDYNPIPVLFDTGSPSSCETIEALQYPVTITSYIKNGVVVIDGTVCADELAVMTHMAALGFTLTGENTYTITQTTDTYTSITFADAIGSLTELFIQSGCTNISDSSVQLITKDSTMCNVPVKSGCNCIIESEEVIETITKCCGSLLECCIQAICDTPTIKVWNPAGQYQIDEKRGIIWLNSDFGADKVLVCYYNDGAASNGEYFIPDFGVDAMLKGIYAKSLEMKERVSISEKKYANARYEKAKDDLYEFMNPMVLAEISRAMRSVIRYGGMLQQNVQK